MTNLARRELLGAGGALVIGAAWPLTAALAAARIKIRDLYRTQAEFSPRALALAGERIEIPGFMAPPLKPDARFFVLTKMPMAVCPFCETAADWPTDIVLVLLARDQGWLPFNRPIIASGRLELGVAVDPETGFVSKVRLADASFAPA